MLLKLVGSAMIIIASALLGRVASMDCRKRPQELRDLQFLFQMFENEISFLSDILVDAFEKISSLDKSSVSVFFRDTARHLKENRGSGASQAWEAAIKKNISRTSLNKEDEEILISFGRMLGCSELEGQIKNIRLTLSQLSMQEKKAEEIRRKNEGFYRKLGMLGGIALVIILI